MFSVVTFLLDPTLANYVLNVIENDSTLSDIFSKEGFANTIAVQVAMGRSTNAVHHLLTLAAESNIDLDSKKFDEISQRAPNIAALHPRDQHVIDDLQKVTMCPLPFVVCWREGSFIVMR